MSEKLYANVGNNAQENKEDDTVEADYEVVDEDDNDSEE